MPGAAALVGCTLCFQDGLALDGALDGHMALCCRRPVPSVSDRVAWVAQRLVVPRDCHDGDGDVRVGRRRSRRLLAMANMVTLTLFCCLVKVGYGRREPRPGATYLTLTNSSVAPWRVPPHRPLSWLYEQISSYNNTSSHRHQRQHARLHRPRLCLRRNSGLFGPLMTLERRIASSPPDGSALYLILSWWHGPSSQDNMLFYYQQAASRTRGCLP